MAGRTTKLQAVNDMLVSIGTQPVNSLGGNPAVDVAIAENILDAVSREVQGEGWAFNMEQDVVFNPDITTGEIELPDNIAEVDVRVENIPNNGPEITDIVMAENKLYDRGNHTFVFTAPSIKVDLIYLREFEDLPQTARAYITIRAKRRFQASVQGDTGRYQITAADEAMARADMMSAEARAGDYNSLDQFLPGRIIRRNTPANRVRPR